MQKFKNILKIILIPLLSFLILPFLLSIFNLLGIFVNKIILIIISSLIMFISGFLIGKKSSNKGYLNGGILGLSFIFILIIVSIFFKINFNIERFIYYIILLLSTVLGSILGINKKKN